MKQKGKTLNQVLEEIGIVKEWEARGKADGVAIGEARGEANGFRNALFIIKGLKNNVPIERLSEESNISVEEIEKIKLEI